MMKIVGLEDNQRFALMKVSQWLDFKKYMTLEVNDDMQKVFNIFFWWNFLNIIDIKKNINASSIVHNW